LFNRTDLDVARDIVGAVLPPTAQIHWPLLSRRIGAELFVKHENHNPTGSFKVRGGLTYFDRLVRERPQVKRLVSATRGNHGQSLAFASVIHGVPVRIFVPHGNSSEKNAAMRAYGAELVEDGTDFENARQAAMRNAFESGVEMVPSFHRDLVVGVATYALELFISVEKIDTLYVPIGLGSGIVGCIMARDLLGLKTEIVGVQASGAPSYALSFVQGRVVETNGANTIADGIATRSPDAEAVQIINRRAARIVQVSEEEITEAIRAYWTDTHNLAEGGAAAALAGAIQERSKLAGKRAAVILSSGNIDLALFRKSMTD
jgi:threonine dehydratase